MSDHEFNNYLTLLAGLLRLGDKQRRAIAEELRTHLEDRLDELLARGVSKEEATRQALSEFGDAAGLAAQFASISRGRRRRWLMRAMTFSVAAVLFMAAGLAILWPGRNAGPGVARAIAQAPAEKQPPPAEAAPAKGRTLGDVLAQRLDLNFSETPLRTVAAQLSERTGVTFYLNAKALNDAGVDIDTLVTAQFKNLRLGTSLRLMLDELELAYFEDAGELIVITTPEGAEARLDNRVYDCRDLLAMEAPAGADKFVPRPFYRGGMGGVAGSGGGMFAVQDEVPGKVAEAQAAPPRQGTANAGGGARQPRQGADDQISVHDLRAEQLIDLITANVRPDTWDSVGGPGAISEYNGLLVVAQTALVHAEVEHVLNMLREAAGLQVDPNGKAKVVR